MISKIINRVLDWTAAKFTDEAPKHGRNLTPRQYTAAQRADAARRTAANRRSAAK